MTIASATLPFHTRATGQMARLRSEAEGLQQQLATGNRLARPSDDPVAAARLRSLGRAEQLSAADSANAARLAADLALADDALQAVGGDLIRIRELALAAANGALPPEGRAAIGMEIAALRATILSSANARDSGGNALFGGQASGPAYAIAADGTATYRGTAQAGEMTLGEGQTVARGVTGPQFLTFQSGGAPVDLFGFLHQLGQSLQSGTGESAGTANAAVATLDDALEALGRTHTVVGTRLDWIDSVRDRRVAADEARAQQTTDIGGVDFAGTVARLQHTLTVLEASQTGFARLAQLSLFDAI